MSLSAPDTIGRYQVLETVGRGGMGNLYLARDPKIGNRRVVIKVLREGFDNPELRERFAREADAAGGLHHVNVVTIFDVGEYEGQPFIAMEYIQGETLTDLIQRRAKLSLGRKLQLMEELCAGLHYAHRAGIVHRDIKPANVMVDQDGVLKILDFGIARLGSSGMTQAGMVMGTLNYMAPEQMAGVQVDARADMFSAGAVFYELLSSRRAFPGELPSIVHKIMTATREPLAALAPDLDPQLVAIVDKCLAREPGDRYADMAAVRREFAAIRHRIAADEQRTLHAHMDEARAAAGRGDYEAVIQACEQVLALDSEYGPAMELQQQTRVALHEQRVREQLLKARGQLDQGALTAASLIVDEVLSADPSASDALAVRDAVDEARRAIAEAQDRARELASALARAEQQLEAGSPDLALQTVEEALGIDAGNADALALKDRIADAVAAKRKAEQEARERAEQEARARATVDDARRQFGAGQHGAALTLLEKFQPAHPIVSAALTELRLEAQEIERRRLEAERRAQEELRRQEQERQRRAREEEERKRAAEAEERRRAEEARRQQEQEEARRRELEAARKREQEEARRREQEAARKRELEEARRREQEEARKRELEEARRREEETRRQEEQRRRNESVRVSPVSDETIHVDPRQLEAEARKALAPDDDALVADKTMVFDSRPAGPRPVTEKKGPIEPRHEAGGSPEAKPPAASPGRWPLVAAAVVVLAVLAGVIASRGRTSVPEPAPLAPAGSPADSPASSPPSSSASSSASTPVSSPTSVVFNVAPWAKIDAITRKTDGKAAGGTDLVTPCVVALAPGEYHVRATNPGFPPLEFDLTVKAGDSQAVRYEMPGFDPLKEASAIVDR